MNCLRRCFPVIVFAGAAFGCGGGGGDSSISPPNPPPPPPPPPMATYTTEAVFGSLGFSQPVALLQAPGDDTRWFILERRGTVRVFDNDPAVASSDIVIDLSQVIDSGPNEAGLLGMAFHPDFANNGFVYLSYTTTGTPLVSNVVRYTSNDGGATLDPNSDVLILSAAQPNPNHNGGQATFGPDGFLYVGFGDGGGGGDPDDNGQDPTNILGAMIRIDVDGGSPYAIPGDNPFAGNATCPQGTGNADCPEIYAWGLRNPWRWSFDRQTGELYVADVGQDSFEEVSRVANGDNLGWNIREGANCFGASSCSTAGLTDPIHEYDHSLGGSITGGYVYRGSVLSSLVGQYVFGDFSSGRIWSFDASAQSMVASTELVDSGLRIASFAEGNDGELLILDIGGSIHRIVEN